MTTRENLLEIGEDLIRQHGFAATGIDQVISSAGVSKGAFYHHFASKEEFTLVLLTRFTQRTLTLLQECLADESVDPRTRLKNFFVALYEDYLAAAFKKGCLLGMAAQELSTAQGIIREGAAENMSLLTSGIASHFESLPKEAWPGASLKLKLDAATAAIMLLDSFEGALLRMRLEQSDAPLRLFLDVYFD